MPHLDEKIDFTTSALIVHENKVLLRRHDKYKIWLSVGGHIEADEDPNQAVIREVKEEVGLTITLVGKAMKFQDENDLIPPRFLNRHHINETHEHIDMIYFATTDDTTITEGETEKSDEIRWFTKDELMDPTLDTKESMRYYALKALEEVSG
jgi:8-oxo-dGTP pyrophosphatase MutT (NUDIX family)